MTLIVKEEDALRIELARTVGALSLNLVGNTTEIPKFKQTTTFSAKSLFENQPEPTAEVKIIGTMTMKSPKDQKNVKFVLTDKGWQEERDLPS